jgi:hypothetical protein
MKLVNADAALNRTTNNGCKADLPFAVILGTG